MKIDDEHKRKLDRFLAEHLLKRGEKISMQETLGKMVNHAMECREFAEEFEELPPLEEDPAWKMHKNPIDMGVKDLSENIDKYVYGE